MCGITGIFLFAKADSAHLHRIEPATRTLENRGPDAMGVYTGDRIALGHTRLSIIDPSTAANQPLSDPTSRYTIVMNGEVHNYKSLRDDLRKKGVTLKTRSDTEVVLHLFIRDGRRCLEKLNGFFAFAVYDNVEERLFIARDRFGIKPLLYYKGRKRLLFASGMRALMALGVPRKIDPVSLNHYFRFSYIPSPHSIFENVRKLPLGHYLCIEENRIEMAPYYTLPHRQRHSTRQDYPGAQSELRSLIADSVRLRMTADVPVGAFLSGGIDSSIIVSEAIRHRAGLETFSIGFEDQPRYDETAYAELAAGHFHTTHHTFRLTGRDLYDNLHALLEDLDEPFADSSALPLHILSRLVKRHVKVVLSGDGADELFGGYNKHRAHWLAMRAGWLSPLIGPLIGMTAPLWRRLPRSRHARPADRWRQLHRFTHGLSRSARERYWYWASMVDETETAGLLTMPVPSEEANARKARILGGIGQPETIGDILDTDLRLVLAGDMLPKVDAMSMAHGLEVRPPYLDHRLVDFVCDLNDGFKVTAGTGKRILRETYRSVLPAAIYRRPKHGFEVPLLRWLKTALREKIETTYLNPDLIEAQRIFDPQIVARIKARLFSSRPGNIREPVWALIVFQHWWQKQMT